MKASWIALLVCALACGDEASEEAHGHDHGDDHGHDHGDHGHDDHGHGHDDHGHDDHGHGHGDHEGASEVITRWGEQTQLFVEFPALVVGEDSPFAAHLTRLRDHFAIDEGRVTVELSGGEQPVERFSIGMPSIPGIFRPVVRPAQAGTRRVTLRLESGRASEEHDLGELTVFETREAADAAAEEEEEAAGEISYLLEQQWQVRFKIDEAVVRPMRPSFPALGRLSLPPGSHADVTASRAGRLVAMGGRFPTPGEEVAEGDVLFGIAPSLEGADSATVDLAVAQATIRVQSAQTELQRVQPLAEQGVVAQRRLQTAQSALSSAQAELRSARIRQGALGRGGAGGASIRLASPLGGVIAEIYFAPGAWVQQGDQVARVVNRDSVWLDIGVPEAYVGRLGNVAGAWFEVEGVATPLQLDRRALVSVGSEVDPDSRTLPVRFRIENVRRELFAGVGVEAHVVSDDVQLTTAIPSSALVDDSGTDVVYVQTGGESFERRAVQLGIRDAGWVEVTGVRPGEWVVSQGAYTVKLASTSTEAIGHGHAH